MDKQKQIEEMAKVMCGNDCEECAKESAYFYGQTLEEARNNKCLLKNCAKTLYNAGYRKIPENAVVLTREELENYMATDLATLVIRIAYLEKKSFNLRKETAEKFAERVKNLEEALLDMVVQFCQMENWGELRHTFMSAEEQAFDVLDITYGEKVDDVYERFNKKWNRPIDEICKELSEGKV